MAILFSTVVGTTTNNKCTVLCKTMQNCSNLIFLWLQEMTEYKKKSKVVPPPMMPKPSSEDDEDDDEEDEEDDE